MRRKKAKPFSKYFLYSGLVHAFAFAGSLISMPESRPKDLLFVNVEMASEADLDAAIPKRAPSQKILEGLDEFIEKEINELEKPEIEEEKPEIQEVPEEKLQSLEPKEVPQEEKTEVKETQEDVKEVIEEKEPQEEIKKEEPDSKDVDEEELTLKQEEEKKVQLEKERRERIKKQKKQELLKSLEKQEKVKKIDDDFAKIFKVAGKLEAEAKKSTSAKQPAVAISGGAGDAGDAFDAEAIGSQIYRYWAVPAGVKDAEKMIVEIEINVTEGGAVIPSEVKIKDMQRYNSDMIFKAVADSAKRAILQASPLRLPKNKRFKSFTFRFNLKKALEI